MRITWLVPIMVLNLTPVASAAPFSLDPTAFSSTATRISYAGTSSITPVDGTIWDEVLHEYFVDGQHNSDKAIFTSLTIPGLNAPAVQGDHLNAVLSLTLPQPVTRFGFDFVLNMEATLPDAVSVQVFDVANVFVGELIFGATIIPGFAGSATKGFAGVGNDVPFTRIELRFNETFPQGPGVPHVGGRVFAVDNLRFEAAEPSALLMLIIAGGLIVATKTITSRL